MAANYDLQNLHDSLVFHDFNCSTDPQQVAEFACKKASDCRELIEKYPELEMVYPLLCKEVEQYKIEPPNPKQFQGLISPCVNRMKDQRWWLRKLKKLQLQSIEHVARKIGLVSKYASTYASSFSQESRKYQKAKNEAYLTSHFIMNEEGDQFSLKDIFSKNVSNPAIRRTELMVRLKGFEEISKLMGHVGEFFTVTSPSCMHARTAKSGLRNKNYDGSSILKTHKFLHGQGRCAIAKLKRMGIELYGFRVVEPHHDGTPHYHWLLFMEPHHRASVRRIFKEYALRDKPEERGARAYRFKAESIDEAKGGATAYIAKYISKNIDGIHIDDDQHRNSGTYAAQAIDAWSSTHNIRQFQQIGGHSVTVWRELRRLADNQPEDINLPPEFLDALLSADSANWAAFTLAMGGPFRGNGTKPLIKPFYPPIEIADPDTGEIREENLSKYGDFKTPILKGIQCNGVEIITRKHEWKVMERPPPDG